MVQHSIKTLGLYIMKGCVNEEYIINVKNEGSIDLVLDFKILQ